MAMITVVAVFDDATGKLEGGVRLKHSTDVTPELLLLGQALQAAMSLTSQYHSAAFLAGEPIQPGKNLQMVADELMKHYHRRPPTL